MSLFSFNSCQVQQNTRVIRLAHSLDINHSVHIAMLEMKDILEKKSNGKMRLEIYPSQQLGTERECLELLQIGTLDMTKVSSGVMENFAPKMKLFGLPFLFKNKQHYYNILDGDIGQQILDNGEEYWLKGLGYYDAGSRSFYTKETPVNTPKDLEGLKIRVMESVTAIEMVNSFGGSPTPISWGELYTSLQQGVVDGAENNPPSFYLSRHYEVCKFYSLDEHTSIPDVLIIGTHIWDKLSKQEQAWLQESVDESVDFQRKLWADAEKEALEAVQDAGVTIIRPDKSQFNEMVKGVYDGYKSNPEFYNLIQTIKNAE